MAACCCRRVYSRQPVTAGGITVGYCRRVYSRQPVTVGGFTGEGGQGSSVLIGLKLGGLTSWCCDRRRSIWSLICGTTLRHHKWMSLSAWGHACGNGRSPTKTRWKSNTLMRTVPLLSSLLLLLFLLLLPILSNC